MGKGDVSLSENPKPDRARVQSHSQVPHEVPYSNISCVDKNPDSRGLVLDLEDQSRGGGVGGFSWSRSPLASEGLSTSLSAYSLGSLD